MILKCNMREGWLSNSSGVCPINVILEKTKQHVITYLIHSIKHIHCSPALQAPEYLLHSSSAGD